MPRHRAFTAILALAGAVYFVTGCVTISMFRDGLGGDDPLIRWMFIGVICIEFAVSDCIPKSEIRRLTRILQVRR